MKLSRLLATLLSLSLVAPCLAQDDFPLPPPTLSSNFRSLERVYAAANGDHNKLWIDGQGRYQVTEGHSPVRILAEGTLSVGQLQRVRRAVLDLRAGEVQDTTVPTNGWGYAVKVDANGVLGGDFSGRAFKRPRVNAIIDDLNALAKSLQQIESVETPSDAEGFAGSEDDVETPSDAEGLAEILAGEDDVETPSDAEGLQDVEGYAGRLVYDGGYLLDVGQGISFRLIGSKTQQLATLLGLYDGQVGVDVIEREDGFELVEVTSPKRVSVRGTYYPEGNVLYGEDGARVPLISPKVLSSLHAKPLVVAGWKQENEPEVYMVGFHAVTTQDSEMLVTYANGNMRDVPLKAGTRALVYAEVGDVFRVRINGQRGSVPKSALRLR